MFCLDFSTKEIKQKLAEESNQNKIKAEEKQIKIKEEKVVQLVRYLSIFFPP